MTHTASSLTTQAVVAAAAVGVVTALGLLWYQKRRRVSVPTVWEPVGKVKSLYIYPLKSGHRIDLKTGICTEFGMRMPKSQQSYQFYDRNLLVYTEGEGRFCTARHYPTMIFIKLVPHPSKENYFILSAPRMPHLTVQIPSESNDKKTTIIKLHFGEEIPAIDCGDDAAAWLSNYLFNSNSGLRLGFYKSRFRRNVHQVHKKYMQVYPFFQSKSTGMYADMSSFLLINQASIDELSSRIPAANITAYNFRPNILVEGEKISAYAEDDWKWVRIGDVVLYTVKPCTRCVLTTIDPETGIKSKENEPIRTLKTYRTLKELRNIDVDGSFPVMGLNMGLQKEGEISVGDTVYLGKD